VDLHYLYAAGLIAAVLAIVVSDIKDFWRHRARNARVRAMHATPLPKIETRFYQYPSTIQQNYDANGSPCSEAPQTADIKVIQTVTLLKPLKFVKITAKLDKEKEE